MSLHPVLQAFADMMTQSGAPPMESGTAASARSRMTMLAQRVGKGPEVARVEEIAIPGRHGTIPARLLTGIQEGAHEGSALVVLIHGGGWVTGSIDDYDALGRALAVAARCRVLLVEYRLAPEHPFPAALEDCVDAVSWADAHVRHGQPLVLMGDSAGANLATVVAQQAREGGPAVDAQILVYPVTDGSGHAYPSYIEFLDGPLLSGRAMDWFWNNYMPDPGQRTQPAASPLHGTLAGLPPTYLLTVEHDPLRDEGGAYAEALRQAGVRVIAEHLDTMAHGFLLMLGLVDQAQRTVERIAELLPELCRPQ